MTEKAESIAPRRTPAAGFGNQTMVEVEGVSRVFPGARNTAPVTAVDGVSLKVDQAEFVALLGPSGCGKTTLLRILAGQETATEGTVRIDGVDMTWVPPEKRPVNMVFQTPALFPHMDVFDNIAFGPRLVGMRGDMLPDLVAEMLALVRLEGFESRSVTQLSGGQAQRVSLARALVNRPKVLLLDEPLSALDLKLRQAMQLELKAIHRQLGTTFIYVTHDQGEAMAMADRIAIMREGAILQIGKPVDIYHHPATVFSSQFVGDSNVLAGTVTARENEGWIVEVASARVRAEPPPTRSGATHRMKAGDPIYVAVRPERITVFPQSATPRYPTDEANSISGRVAETVFTGPSIRYVIEIDDAVVISATQPFSDDAQVLALGTAVVATWHPRDCAILTG